jgi:protein-S-isoprenylcysteine O-methyltransferase Ste14
LSYRIALASGNKEKNTMQDLRNFYINGHLGTWAMLPILGLFVFWITENQIKAEEHALVKIFGSKFEDYKSKVRRWI